MPRQARRLKHERPHKHVAPPPLPRNVSTRRPDVGASMSTSFESPESSNVKGASYDPDTKQLVVTFHEKRNLVPESGEVVSRAYIYEGIEPETWADFAQARSKGSYFQSCIKPFYEGRRQL